MKFNIRVLSYTATQVEVVIPDWNSYTAINIKALTVFDLAPHNFSQ